MSEQTADQYRFEGYQLPKIQLDETGPSYVVLNPHPYFYNQPEYWHHPAYKDNHPVSGVTSGNGGTDNNLVDGSEYSIQNGIPFMLPF